MNLCCSQGALSNPLIATVYHVAQRAFKAVCIVCWSATMWFLVLTAAWDKKEMGGRANALGCAAVHGTETKGEIHCVKVAVKVVKLLFYSVVKKCFDISKI